MSGADPKLDAGSAKDVLEKRRRTCVLAGDCLERLAELPDGCVDACLTDPPYGLSTEPDIAEVLQHWVAGDAYEHSASGFMGKSWDSFVPGPEYWRAIFRVMKPGAHLLAFCGTRTWDLLSIAIRFAGFENRDTIRVDGPPALGWIHGQGFAKGLNVSKALDKAAGAEREVVGHADPHDPRTAAARKTTFSGFSPEHVEDGVPITAPATDEAKEWDGWATALKPAWEVILIFRKPLVGTVAANVEKHGTGAFNIDASRVRFASAADEAESKAKNRHGDFGSKPRVDNTVYGHDDRQQDNYEADARYPANMLLVHSPECRKVGTRRVKTGTTYEPGDKTKEHTVYGNTRSLGRVSTYADADDGTEEIEAWECAAGCAVAALDAQAGKYTTRPGAPRSSAEPGNGWGMTNTGAEYSDSGGRSRFFNTFSLDAELDAPFFYNAKAGADGRSFYCRVCKDAYGAKDKARHRHEKTDWKHLAFHTTVKPASIMKWAAKLITRAGGVILDPFAGTGTTGVAAQQEGFRAILVERDPEYFQMARRRLEDDSPLFAFMERAGGAT